MFYRVYEDTLVFYWLEAWHIIQEVVGSNTGATTPEESCVFSKIQLIALTYIHMFVIENALGRELWTPSAAHQCTPVVLNCSCWGVRTKLA